MSLQVSSAPPTIISIPPDGIRENLLLLGEDRNDGRGGFCYLRAVLNEVDELVAREDIVVWLFHGLSLQIKGACKNYFG